MKILIQRVLQASVAIEKKTIGSIGKGALLFIGITHGDSAEQACWLASKFLNLRIFEDEQGKTNSSIIEKKGAALIISQFTLYADTSVGRRPSFTAAADPLVAKQLYETFIQEVRKGGIVVEQGVFGAVMEVSLINDGPFTLLLERNGAV